MSPTATLARALRSDALFTYYFPRSPMRWLLLWSFFRDELAFRREHGQVVAVGAAVAFLGDWPLADLPLGRLSLLTRLLLRLQPPEVRQRWTKAPNLNPRRPLSQHRYLSVIGTPRARRGRGDGTRLIKRLVNDAGAAGLDLYLETSSARLSD